MFEHVIHTPSDLVYRYGVVMFLGGMPERLAQPNGAQRFFVDTSKAFKAGFVHDRNARVTIFAFACNDFVQIKF